MTFADRRYRVQLNARAVAAGKQAVRDEAEEMADAHRRHQYVRALGEGEALHGTSGESLGIAP